MEAFGSPMGAAAIMPLLMIEARLDAEECRLPKHEIRQLADLDRAHQVRDAMRDRWIDGVLGDVALDAGSCRCRAGSPRKLPRCSRILCAVCQVRMMTSPTRPMACESEDIMEKAPISCRISSAAIVSRRMRDSAKAMSSAMAGSRWWHTISMSRCSSMVLMV